MMANLIFLYSVVSFLAVECFTPNCVRQNQFINYDFPVEACSNKIRTGCKFHPKGYFKSVGDVTLVKIMEVSVVPSCAFYSAPSLNFIYGVNSKIEVLATKAFMNLPNIKSICLAFNAILEVQKDVFSAEMIDLSWNKIKFVDSDAFKEVDNLKYLNLSKNSLTTLSINSLGRNIRVLNLSSNLLKVFLLNSAFFENLNHINASDNDIDKVAISFQYPAELLDLSSNRIQNFDYMDMSYVDTFNMGENMFQKTPRYLENINARQIAIYPNPWKCDELFLLWETLVSYNIDLVPRKGHSNSSPYCTQTDHFSYYNANRPANCTDDFECPSSMTCRARKCWNPCDESICHQSSLCQTTKHRFTCFCPFNEWTDQLDIRGECKKPLYSNDVDLYPGYFYPTPSHDLGPTTTRRPSPQGPSAERPPSPPSTARPPPPQATRPPPPPRASQPPPLSTKRTTTPATRPPPPTRPPSQESFVPVTTEEPEPWWIEEIPNIKPPRP